MMKTKLTSIFALLALGISGASAQEESKHTLNDFNLGEVVAGDEDVADDTKGKVVVLEFWGPR